jgi:hypothetical protein
MRNVKSLLPSIAKKPEPKSQESLFTKTRDKIPMGYLA